MGAIALVVVIIHGEEVVVVGLTAGCKHPSLDGYDILQLAVNDSGHSPQDGVKRIGAHSRYCGRGS